MRRLRFLVVPLALLALFAAGCGGGGGKKSSASSAKADVTIKDFNFTTVKVKAGATVSVRNDDGTNHTVTSDQSGQFDTGKVKGHSDSSFKAPGSAGSYKFHCEFHSDMHGTLTVQ